LEVSFLINIVDEFGQYYKGGSYETNTSELRYIDTGGDDEVYYRCIDFPRIEALMMLTKYKEFRKPDEPFTNKEKILISHKIDEVLNELKTIKLGNEIIWTDVMAELNELKSHLELSKRNWRQLLTGKLAEMVIGGS
jgi:hypothetical protein